MDDLISRKQALDAFGLSEKTRKYGGDHSGYNTMMLYEIQDVIEGLPSVNPQANNEDIHREREQAYMRGYEDASKRYRTEPCGDAISRTDAIRVASGYCHWTNIPDELAKLPSVNPIQCEDVISRQAALDEINRIGVKAFETYDDYSELFDFVDSLPSVSCSESTNKCEDAVSRELVKKDIARWIGYIDEDMIARMHITIDKLPSVSTEKTGRWILTDKEEEIYCHVAICSVCGKESINEGVDDYCSWCGAKMEVEE